MAKKTISVLLMLIIVFNFIFSSIPCYAEEVGTDGTSYDDHIYAQDANYANLTNDNQARKAGEEGKYDDDTMGTDQNISTDMGGASVLGAVIGYVSLIIDIIPLQIHFIISEVATTDYVNKDDLDSWRGGKYTNKMFEGLIHFVTIEDIVFNLVSLFNIDYFDTEDTIKVGSVSYVVEMNRNKANTTLSDVAARLFFILRIFSAILALAVLVYIGIRMAIASIAQDKAKYKHMLVSWVESIAVLFLLSYIMVICVTLSEVLTNIFFMFRCTICKDTASFEEIICDNILGGIFQGAGFKMVMYSVMYWLVVYTQLKFFILYFKRTLVVAFLIIIAPLITITYPIDKAGDGKAQAFNAWLSEYIFMVFVQPLHAIVYLIFMFIAGAIAEYAPLVALAFMMSLTRVEHVVKKMFDLNKSVALGGLGDMLKKL